LETFAFTTAEAGFEGRKKSVEFLDFAKRRRIVVEKVVYEF
jgi:hypothetical protein